jgi:uncharacterized protein YdiU (UPF0061 family)
MASLGVPTTRSLAVVTTGEPVYRESIRRGAVLTRVAASHLRVGTCEYAVRLGGDAVRQLADYAILRHDPEIGESSSKYLEFFKAVVDRQASLVAQWLLVGFVHGVMNTDNMAISGETIDYGPCAFMNVYDPGTVFSSIDRGGRYAYGNQPHIAQWNLARFAETLLSLFDPDGDQAAELAMEVLNDYPRRFEGYWLAGMRAKLGLRDEQPGDLELVQSLLKWMEESRADFTNTFRELSQSQSPCGEGYQDPQFRVWFRQWKDRTAAEGHEKAMLLMQSVNPAVIPRNHRVEEALRAAEDDDDLGPLRRLLEVLRAPFDARDEFSEYRNPPDDESGYRTFCGT